MSNDLISRQSAIEILGKHCNMDYGKVCGKDCECIEYMALRDMPSTQQWIPCSERMPEEREGKYLVSINGNVFYSTFGAKVWGFPWYIDDTESWVEDVDAWMPLPEPYTQTCP